MSTTSASGADAKSRIRPRSRRPAGAVRESVLSPGFGLVIESNQDDLDLVSWVEPRRAELLDQLDTFGAVLLRGFSAPDPERFGAAARAIGGELLGYIERAARRTEVADHVFTSTEFSADQVIPLHHEMSYSTQWPGRLYFYCQVAADEGGATPLASERLVTSRIPADLRERFERTGVTYVRNYRDGLDMPWQEVFQTDDRAEVEVYCQSMGMVCTWNADGLTTRTARPATVRHPRTGEALWFNHAHLFHSSNMPPEVEAALLSEYGAEGLPRNVFFGDGEPIDASMIAAIRELYHDAAVTFDWRPSDVLLVDNHLAVHGRAPFVGQRTTLVAMTDLFVDGVAQ